MGTIREFEDRVNAEMATGDIPGADHLYADQEAGEVGVACTSATATTSRIRDFVRSREHIRSGWPAAIAGAFPD